MTLVDLTIPSTRTDRLDGLPVAIVGAGPIGLAAAAHLAERGIPFEVSEAGDTIADSINRWGHTRLFSPWRHLVDPAARRLLEASGWQHPREDGLPTGAELVEEYLRPLAALPQIAPHLVTGAEVTAISRDGADRTRTSGREATPFVLRIAGRDGVRDVRARAVIDASGTYRTPNSLASSGLDPLGADDVRDLVTHALPDVLGRDRGRFAGKHTIVVGAGHSAANTLLKLAELADTVPGTTATWVIRNSSAIRVSSSAEDELPARASIGGRVDSLVTQGRIRLVDRFETVRLRRDDDRVTLIGQRAGALEELTADVIVNATGFRPDLGMLREIRLDLDDIVEAPRRLAPLIDPNVHSCGTVQPHGFAELAHPEQNFFIAGMKSYGRAPTFLLATGYEQVRSIVAHLAGDVAAASNVELVLPATGVCSSSLTDTAASASSCCGPASPSSCA
ncbi:NAD(P)-binding domain-containing protein [Agromyces larvae]|uniref:NAD(P)-binding domain-containing protein n=1 Tax=Agromyces larvae TaxID=2929802 RepID=A0ABY4BW01_9MICO|nr:NAD(P)-binding domain-containing protein [Agromyces larvae]UOE43372.1 NAD(P)-binding domain-containing protein [Agromyces larvae]